MSLVPQRGKCVDRCNALISHIMKRGPFDWAIISILSWIYELAPINLFTKSRLPPPFYLQRFVFTQRCAFIGGFGWKLRLCSTQNASLLVNVSPKIEKQNEINTQHKVFVCSFRIRNWLSVMLLHTCACRGVIVERAERDRDRSTRVVLENNRIA